jgi:hypothetical protein
MKTHIYVDGFNLYYGCLRRTSFRWLNIDRLCQVLLPNDDIRSIKYFTARVSSRPQDPKQHIRQQIYLRALKTIPHLEIIYGHFLTHPVKMRLAHPKAGQSLIVEVLKTEEKGSDVNLASHLLHDGHLGKYELAVVITNDSDLSEPIRIVAQELKIPVGLINPHKHPSQTLIKQVNFVKNIRENVLRNCQFDATLTDSVGEFYKPTEW